MTVDTSKVLMFSLLQRGIIRVFELGGITNEDTQTWIKGVGAMMKLLREPQKKATMIATRKALWEASVEVEELMRQALKLPKISNKQVAPKTPWKEARVKELYRDTDALIKQFTPARNQLMEFPFEVDEEAATKPETVTDTKSAAEKLGYTGNLKGMEAFVLKMRNFWMTRNNYEKAAIVAVPAVVVIGVVGSAIGIKVTRRGRRY